MNIFKILKNPIVKWAGIILIIYFALFANKKSPQSLGNRLSKENVEKNLNQMKEKSKFIVSNVRLAKEVAKEREAQRKVDIENAEGIIVKDVEIGAGDKAISCADIVEISYGIYASDGKQLEFVPKEKITIGSKKNWPVEKNIIGLKKAAVREINLPGNIQTADEKLLKLLKLHPEGLKYQVTVLSFAKSGSQLSCN
jgi:hypothetical protein